MSSDPRRRLLLLRRLLLALASLVVTFLLLEVAARVAFPHFAPIQLRDGVYLSRLPLVNGRPSGRESEAASGKPLPVEKAPNELRIFTFGESSMVGCPWGYAGAPPTILHDLLRAAFPGRRITVVNMGHTSSFVMDSYYYLLSIAPFQPDFVVFYQGANDRFDLDEEMCAPHNHPQAYAAWRWIVGHSRLFYVVRLLGPEHVGALRVSEGMERGSPERCPWSTFGQWTDLVVETAQATGARVVIASPVRSVLDGIDFDRSREPPDRALAAMSGLRRDLLACQLTPGCDFIARLDELGLKTKVSYLSNLACYLVPGCPAKLRRAAQELARSAAEITDRGEYWRATAKSHGIAFVDFRNLFIAQQPHGVMGPPAIVDEVHLTLDGYALLASTWAKAIGEMITGRKDFQPPAADLARYRRDVGPEMAIRLALGIQKIRTRRFFVSTALLQPAAAADPQGPAAQLLGWMRMKLGLPSGLPAPLEAKALHLDQEAVLRQAMRDSHP